MKEHAKGDCMMEERWSRVEELSRGAALFVRWILRVKDED